MLPFVVPAVSLGLSLASQAANAIGGAYQKHQKKRLGELDGDVAGQRGLSAAEAQTMTNTGMAPTRAMAGSMASELARVQAAGGGIGGGAAAAQARDTMARTIGSSAEKVGYRVAAANQEALGAKRQEVEDRMAAQAQRKTDITNQWMGTLSDAATQAGDMIGAVPGTFNLSGDIEQQAAAGRDARAARAGVPSSAPTSDDAMVTSRRASAAMALRRDPALMASIRTMTPEGRNSLQALVNTGVPLVQAIAQVMGG
jgi:hypothetical protein